MSLLHIPTSYTTIPLEPATVFQGQRDTPNRSVRPSILATICTQTPPTAQDITFSIMESLLVWAAYSLRPGLMFFFLAGLFGQTLGFAALVAMAYWLFLAVIVFSAEQVFTAALYLYAKEDRVPQGFGRIDLKSAWEGLPPLPAGQAL